MRLSNETKRDFLFSIKRIYHGLDMNRNMVPRENVGKIGVTTRSSMSPLPSNMIAVKQLRFVPVAPSRREAERNHIPLSGE
jgi:hypothetical protein